MVQVVDTSSNHETTLAMVCKELQLPASDVQQIPYVLVGAVDDVIAKIIACRERWGITYFAVRELDRFAPVIDAFRGA
jgi:hypothetical protein